ncbi:hypothetical protein [Streptomyces sp. NPDC048277]|uniref:hypothetical protein n=1 Tax=Streptomyces sp. NPDC048277 TaxID=3155027 RepID=UPI0033ECCA38
MQDETAGDAGGDVLGFVSLQAESGEDAQLGLPDGCGGGGCNGTLAFTKENGLTSTVPKAVSEAWAKPVMARATASP